MAALRSISSVACYLFAVHSMYAARVLIQAVSVRAAKL